MTKKPTLEEVHEMFKGKGGNEESETILNDSNIEKKEGYVSVWSNKADAAKIIERCKNSIRSFQLVSGGVQLEIDRRAFRGIICSFRRIKK